MMSLFVYFSDEEHFDYDLTGIVDDVRTSSSGYTFTVHSYESEIRCFSKERPETLGYYAIRGNLSNDGSIFFVERMMNIDINRNQD